MDFSYIFGDQWYLKSVIEAEEESLTCRKIEDISG